MPVANHSPGDTEEEADIVMEPHETPISGDLLLKNTAQSAQ
jgi:hypothetical protein